MTELKKTPEQWINLIAHQELPALTSTAKLLDKFANDDVSSLPRLSKAILHDQALSSCLLKVANNVQRIGVSRVTTVSRATVILGIQPVKNICLTAKVIDSLIKNKSTDVKVFNRIKKMMACSFYAGQLAKMMIPHYSDETQEEVYLATMLHRIGETAFWCLGTEHNDSLSELIQLPTKEREAASQKLLGMSFTELSVGLAKQWNLGDLLIKSLDHPENRTTEMQVIYLADMLSTFIASPPSEAEFNQVIEDIAHIMQVNTRQVKHRIELTRGRSLTLLNSYGADTLIEHIHSLPKPEDFSQDEQTITATPVSKETALLKAIQQLTHLTTNPADINTFLTFTLKSLAEILAFDVCIFFLLTDEKTTLTSRFAFNNHDEALTIKKLIKLNESNNLFRQAIKKQQHFLINNTNNAAIKPFITAEIADLFIQKKTVISPVQINQNSIGLIYGCKIADKSDISDDDYNQFTFFIQHLSMCLSLTNRRK